MEQQKTGNTAGTSLAPSECVASIKSLLKQRKIRAAYELARTAAVQYGEDPFILSYFGYLQAKVDGKYRTGIDACNRGLSLFRRKAVAGDADERHAALLYLNLSKAYTAAGRRKNAVEALSSGLKCDRTHRELLAELQRLGTRKLIPIPFLKRSNFLNELIGRIMRKKRTDTDEY